MKRILFSALAILSLAVTATADPLLLPGDTPIYFQFNNLEQVDAQNDLVVPGGYNGTETQGNWGVFNISTIQFGGVATPNVDISGGSAFFVDDGTSDLFGQGQITGIFYGIQLTSATTAVGGYIDLYWHDPADDFVTAACLDGNGCGPDSTTVANFTSGTFLARLAFASGIDPADSNVFIKSSTDPTTINGSGEADSFANVDLSQPGLWTDALNGDWFITNFGTRDVRFSNFYNFLSQWGDGTDGTTGLRSNDPGRVFTAPVPEPATLTLLGLGLMGFATRARRRNKA